VASDPTHSPQFSLATETISSGCNTTATFLLAQQVGIAEKAMTAEQVRKIVREELTHTR
jgi:hypothetical protein